jgi:hypothetical protein
MRTVIAIFGRFIASFVVLYKAVCSINYQFREKLIMSNYHLAQLNIAKAKDEMNSATMKGFVDRLDEINSLADRSPGFIWRLQTEEGDATSIKIFNDPSLIVNMSVWENIESLKNYVYKSVHIELIRSRNEWFHKMDRLHQVLWYVPIGHKPSVEEAEAKLLYLEQHGSTENAGNSKKCITSRSSIATFGCWTVFKSRFCGFAAQKYSTKPQLKNCRLARR